MQELTFNRITIICRFQVIPDSTILKPNSYLSLRKVYRKSDPMSLFLCNELSVGVFPLELFQLQFCVRNPLLSPALTERNRSVEINPYNHRAVFCYKILSLFQDKQ